VHAGRVLLLLLGVVIVMVVVVVGVMMMVVVVEVMVGLCIPHFCKSLKSSEEGITVSQSGLEQACRC